MDRNDEGKAPSVHARISEQELLELAESGLVSYEDDIAEITWEEIDETLPKYLGGDDQMGYRWSVRSKVSGTYGGTDIAPDLYCAIAQAYRTYTFVAQHLLTAEERAKRKRNFEIEAFQEFIDKVESLRSFIRNNVEDGELRPECGEAIHEISNKVDQILRDAVDARDRLYEEPFQEDITDLLHAWSAAVESAPTADIIESWQYGTKEAHALVVARAYSETVRSALYELANRCKQFLDDKN